MNTARAQKNTTDTSKGNSSRSSLFIAPTQLKKNKENTAAKETPDLFIVASHQKEARNARKCSNV